jgi:hypothetical protein
MEGAMAWARMMTTITDEVFTHARAAFARSDPYYAAALDVQAHA